MAVISNASPNPFTTGRCSLCGKPPAAMWVGLTGTVEICRECADLLPALYADAVAHPWNWPNVERAINQAKATFWRALASRLAAAVRTKARG